MIITKNEKRNLLQKQATMTLDGSETVFFFFLNLKHFLDIYFFLNVPTKYDFIKI